MCIRDRSRTTAKVRVCSSSGWARQVNKSTHVNNSLYARAGALGNRFYDRHCPHSACVCWAEIDSWRNVYIHYFCETATLALHQSLCPGPDVRVPVERVFFPSVRLRVRGLRWCFCLVVSTIHFVLWGWITMRFWSHHLDTSFKPSWRNVWTDWNSLPQE